MTVFNLKKWKQFVGLVLHSIHQDIIQIDTDPINYAFILAMTVIPSHLLTCI